MKDLKRLLFLFTVLVSAAAVIDQLQRPPEERTWHGTIFGVPYDFRPPNLQRLRDAWWNPDDPRLLTPRDFGVGWAINLYRLKELVTGRDKDGDSDI
ncbi:MAG: hypothetical protein GEU75_06725 [Dehalococcoidia bacterium]|nr:hypothetical protein [Dehalococcoidia bacterium]